MKSDYISKRERVLSVLFWHAVCLGIWFILARFGTGEPFGSAGLFILLYMQFFALMISLPFMLSSSRAAIGRGIQVAGLAMLSAAVINQLRDQREQE